jgi:DnaJ-class molecular chaperone
VDALTAAKKPAARRKPARPKPAPVKCSDCDGHGEITEAVKVGARKGRITDHRQAGLCLTCLGTGEAATD